MVFYKAKLLTMTTVKELKALLLTYWNQYNFTKLRNKISDLEKLMFDESMKSDYIYDDNTTSYLENLLTAYIELESETNIHFCDHSIIYYNIDTIDQKKLRIRYLHDFHRHYELPIMNITENGKTYKTEKELKKSLKDKENTIFIGDTSITEVKELLQELIEDDIDVTDHDDDNLKFEDFEDLNDSFYVFAHYNYKVMLLNNKTISFIQDTYDSDTEFIKLDESKVATFKNLKKKVEN